MELTASKLLGGVFGIGAIGGSLLGVLIGVLFLFTSPLAGVGILAASGLLFLAGLLAFATTRRVLDTRLGLSISGGAAVILISGLAIVSILVFGVSVGGGLLAAADMSDDEGYTGPGSDVSNVTLDADDTTPRAADTELDVRWNARAQSAVNPDQDSLTKYSADDGEKYIVVRLHITNTGAQEIELTPRLFQLNQTGVVHDPTILFGSSGGISVTLQPGAETRGYVVFTVSAESTSGTLTVTQEVYPQRTVAVTFTHDDSMPIEMAD